MEKIVDTIINEMSEYLDIKQLRVLQESLTKHLVFSNKETKTIENSEYLRLFIDAKRIEGCSERTLFYYETTLNKMMKMINMPIRKILSEDIRHFLSEYQELHNCSKTTLNNVRRNISSFFTWLEQEDYILKSPMRKIHKIKTDKTIKNVISDEDIEKLRDNCLNLRDLSIIDLLYSTGIRVGELVNLNKDDINLNDRECVVFGKGNKERKVYFDARTKLHLIDYLNSREDDNQALFVSLDCPHERLNISGVEIRLRNMGKKLSMDRIHPHKFRRSMATKAIDKGMPIEQVQKILGHSQIDTTLQYAIVNQNNVKNSHRKYLS